VGMDSYEGDQEDPLSLHKYTFGENNPVNNTDPSGNQINADSGAFYDAMVSNSYTDVSYAPSVDPTDDNIKRLIQDFYNAAKKNPEIGVQNINVLASLGWSESPNGKLGYWDRKAGPANGIMQLTDPKFAGADDATNIDEGAKILSGDKIIEVKSRPRGFVQLKTKTGWVNRKLTPEQQDNEWDLAVWLYKGEDNGNTHDWLVNIYPHWPVVTSGQQITSEPLISLWNNKDSFLVK
jgi:hypothetical protein